MKGFDNSRFSGYAHDSPTYTTAYL